MFDDPDFDGIVFVIADGDLERLIYIWRTWLPVVTPSIEGQPGSRINPACRIEFSSPGVNFEIGLFAFAHEIKSVAGLDAHDFIPRRVFDQAFPDEFHLAVRVA